MSETKNWTKAQENAINSLNGTILVSAAAGSGKTSVLVERIIKRITKEKSPSSINNLLIVTFTKAAASEMRKRLSDELSKLIVASPNDENLKKQKMYLADAQICTMDSFCNKIIKENYETLGISPDFTVLSDNDNSILLNEIADDILKDIYNSDAEDDESLLALFTNDKNDLTLRKLIVDVYDKSMSNADPDEWLENIFKYYFDDTEPEKTPFGQYSLFRLKEKILYILEKIDEGGRWDDIRDVVSLLKKSYKNFETFKAEEKDALFYTVKARRDSLKSEINSLNDILISSISDFESDILYLRPIMSALKKRIKQYSQKVATVKQENNTYYFADILHFTLNLLYTVNEAGEKVKTPLAQELSEEFDEILIDEFQDTNEAQVSLFNAISKDGSNEFIVGDVKQSIYSFRQACPEIFVSLLNKCDFYKDENYPSRIALDSNFRSRKGVVDSINYFCDFLMIPEVGGIDYKKTERLVYGAKGFSEHDEPDTQVHVVTSNKGNSSNLVEEAKYVGKLINQMIDDKMLIGKGEDERPVQYKDICILLRTVKDKAEVMAGEFKKLGIPVHYEKSNGLFGSAEIMTLISMLRVIDNPLQDVPMLSVLLSPLTSFTEDDIAKMRTEKRYGSLYSVVKNSASKNPKAKSFISMLDYFRTLSVTLTTADLIRRIFEVTAYDCVVSAMDDGEKRVLNLQSLISFAESYTESGNFGLSGFIRYIDKLQKNGTDLEGADTVSENDNVVRIMTVHKSKGLEFPVVIFANTNLKFHKENKDKLLINKNLGLGALRYLEDENREIKTQIFTSIYNKNISDSIEENLRILYVALTRAREKLIIVGSFYKPLENLPNLYYDNDVSEQNLPYVIKNSPSFFNWILLATLHHPMIADTPLGLKILGRRTIKTDSKIAFYIAETPTEEEATGTIKKPEYLPDEKIIEKIKEKVTYEYPYESLSGVPILYTASSMDKTLENKYFATENPSFLSTDSFTPAQRGTLIHRFMEVCNLENAAANLDAEIKLAIERGDFTETEANVIDKEKISKFFKSDMFKRIMCADEYLREKQFSLSLPLNSIQKDLSIDSSEMAVVQGVIDGLILTGENGEIIDFKTDRVKSADELRERYKSQMFIYKQAAEKCFGAKNVKVTLYSFELSEEISVIF